jgi:molybdate transport system substrate-binding protein
MARPVSAAARFGHMLLHALFIILFAGASVAALAQPRTDAPVIAAAADLRFALEELAATYTRESGQPLRLSFGSSGQFYQQLNAGAPFQLFLSADEDYVLRLARAGRTVDQGALYAVGRLALVVPPASRVTVDSELAGLRAAFAANRVKRFAIANPEHAPYGQRAEEALRHAGLWTAAQPKLVYGENVSQALQFATAGGADGGIVALSLVLAPAFQGKGRYAIIPETWHQPLRQRMVLMKGAGETAQHFYHWLQQPRARAVLARYGFAPPADSSGAKAD